MDARVYPREGDMMCDVRVCGCMHAFSKFRSLSATISPASAIYPISGDRSPAAVHPSISDSHLSRLVHTLEISMPKLTLCVLPPGVNLAVAGHRPGVVLPCLNRLPCDISAHQVAGAQATSNSEMYRLCLFLLAIFGGFSLRFSGFSSHLRTTTHS